MILIGISGKKRSGKDALCEALSKQLLKAGEKPYRIAFADALKNEVARAVGKDAKYIDENKDCFRLILQGWGTDYRRKLFGEDYWIKKWLCACHQVISFDPKATIIVPDVRFENEVETIKLEGGKVINIFRYFKETDIHKSENELVGYDKFDAQIENEGALDELDAFARDFLITNYKLKL